MRAIIEKNHVRVNNTVNTRIKMGKYSYSRENIEVLAWGEKADLVVGAFTSIAKGCRCFLGGNHRTEWGTTYPFGLINTNTFKGSNINTKEYSQTNGSINIGNDVWIGLNVTIMSGVHIGDGAVIAANSHVVRDVEAYSINGGNPAKLIKYRFNKDIIKEMMALKWWRYSDEKIDRIIPELQRKMTMRNIIRIKQILGED